MVKQIVSTVCALAALASATIIGLGLSHDITRGIGPQSMSRYAILLVILATSGGAAWLFYRKAKADGGFPFSRMLILAFGLIAAMVAALMLYKVGSYLFGWILWPMWRTAWETPWQALGVVLFFGPIILAYPAHYYLNVKKTNSAGVIEVDGFWDIQPIFWPTSSLASGFRRR